jgi:hypothetical protein
MLYISVISYGQSYPAAYINKLTSEYNNAKDDSLKIEKLSKLAFYYFDYLGNRHLADSTSQAAIDLAESSYRTSLLVLAYNRYVECNDGTYLQKALRYAQEAVKLSTQANNIASEWRSYSNLVKAYQSAYDYDKALGSSYQALALADGQASEQLKAESYLLIGESLEGDNQKIEAFRNYLNAAAIAEKLNKPDLLKKCYSMLAEFYNNSKLFDKAIAYKLKQLDLIVKVRPVDSAEYMWAQYYLQVINVNSNNNRLNTRNFQEVFDYAIRNNNTRLKNYEIALYRSHLIEADDIATLYSLYNIQYPAELLHLETENPAMYYRLKAYFSEEEQRPDSAYYYLARAEQLLQQDPNKILRSNFYQRYGQFLIRQGKPKDAISKYLMSYDLSREASYFDYMLSASGSLESLYAGLGDYKNAYTYSTLNRALTDSISTLSKNDQLLMMEIDHESKQRELAAEQEHTQTHRRHNIQYTAITIIIFSMFILLMMLGSLKVPSWTIKMLGFFSFILFFEFIIMIADHKIYEITSNEPWKILLIKIGLIAFLLPFHHWIEKKVIHFLIEKKLIKIPRFSIQRILRMPHQESKKKTESVEL